MLIILDSILMVLVENLSVHLLLIIYYHEPSLQCGNRNHRNESFSCLSSHFQFNVEKVNSVVSCFHLFFFFFYCAAPTEQMVGNFCLSTFFFTRCWSHGRSCLLPKNCILTKFKITQRVGAMGWRKTRGSKLSNDIWLDHFRIRESVIKVCRTCRHRVFYENN